MTKAPFMYPDKLPAFPANITPSSSSVYTPGMSEFRDRAQAAPVKSR